MQEAEKDFVNDGGLDALVEDLMSLSKSIDDYDPKDLMDPGMDEPSIDCRLRYFDGNWSFVSGSSDYDQDHRGAWGASSVGPKMSTDTAISITNDLKEQVLEQLACQGV